MTAFVGQSGAARVRAIEQRIRDLSRALGVRYTIELRLSTEEGRKVGWFNDGTRRQPARPFMSITAPTRAVALDAMLAQPVLDDQQRPRIMPMLMIAGAAIKRIFVSRLSTGTLDGRPLARLAASTLLKKRRLHQPLHPGVATGAMLRAVRGAQIIVKRT